MINAEPFSGGAEAPVGSRPFLPTGHWVSRRVFATVAIALAGLVGTGSIVWWKHSLWPFASSPSTLYDNEVSALKNPIMFGFDALHTHVNPYEQRLDLTKVSQLTIRGFYGTGNGINSSPVVVRGTLYIGSQDKNVYAINTVSRAKKWAFSTGDAISSSPAVARDTVYIGSQDGNLYAIDATSGRQQWVYSTEGIVDSSPAVANDVVYIGSHDGTLYAIDATTGKKKWAHSTGGPIVFSSPAVVEGTVYIGSHDHNLYAIDATSGRQQWAYSTRNFDL